MERRKTNKSGQAGFTLIELIAVIVILGILAVVAIPKFVDLQEEAAQASVEGVAGALSSAFALNYAACAAGNAACVAITNCSDGSGLLVDMPTGYTITAGAVTAGTPVNCTLTGEKGKTATFVAF